MFPRIGTFVEYKLTQQDADAINRRRTDAAQSHIAQQSTGAQVHVGNGARAGDVLPMLVVRRNGDTLTSTVNGQVFLDGNDTLWVTSVHEGTEPRDYQLQR